MAPVHDPVYQGMLARLRQAREDCGLRQADVAARLGKPQSYVSKVESGERRIDPSELVRFAEVYAKPLEWFLS